MIFASLEDLETLWRPLQNGEEKRAEALIEVISDSLREEAIKVNKDLDKMVKDRPSYKNTVKSVVIDIVARTLMTSTNQEPMIQGAQSALGYSISGTYLVPGGGIFIKNTELAKLGLKRQKMQAIEIFDFGA